MEAHYSPNSFISNPEEKKQYPKNINNRRVAVAANKLLNYQNRFNTASDAKLPNPLANSNNHISFKKSVSQISATETNKLMPISPVIKTDQINTLKDMNDLSGLNHVVISDEVI